MDHLDHMACAPCPLDRVPPPAQLVLRAASTPSSSASHGLRPATAPPRVACALHDSAPMPH